MSTLSECQTAEVDGRPWSIGELAGRAYVVVFGNRHAKDDVVAIVDELQRHEETADLNIVQVAHLKGLPKPLRALATRDMRKGREKQLTDRAKYRAQLGLPADTGDVLRIAMDWSGQITDLFGFTGTQKSALTLFVNAVGEVTGSYEGREAGSLAREWIRSREATH